ncbi:MAG: regulatory protein GemA [Methylovulum sp.]|nr:regulatory protein GemA [Methylovulum sp.]
MANPHVGYAARTETDRRAALVKKINTARRQLGWDDAAWETIKFMHGNCQSIAKDAQPQASMAQLEAIMGHARACGFKDTYQKAAGKRSAPLSQAKQAKLLRGLWLELHTLGAVQDPDETALCRWVMTTRKGAVQGGHVTTNLAFLEWRGDDLHQAIERLKQWRLRWLRSGKMACPECGKAFKPTDKQARAFGKIACQAHTPDVAYVFIPPVAKEDRGM